jgi:hypothetical protein
MRCFPHRVFVPFGDDQVTPIGFEAVKLDVGLSELCFRFREYRAIGEILPLTHFVRATRSVLLKGEGASVVLYEMLPVALFTQAATVSALGLSAPPRLTRL